MCYSYIGRHREVVEVAKEYLTMAEDRGDLELLYFGYASFAMNYTRLGRDQDVRGAASRALQYFPQ